MITTTLKAIRKASPCGLRPKEDGTLEGYAKLKAFLGDDYPDDAPIKFSTIVESNGIDDAYWCLRTICPEYKKDIILLAAEEAESVLHIYEAAFPNDCRVRDCIQATKDYANGLITIDKFRDAAAAGAAAARAVWAARAADWAARAADLAARADRVSINIEEFKAAQLKRLTERFS